MAARQCHQAACTAGAVLRTVGRNFQYRDRNIYMRLYRQYVRPRPHLEFATPAWSHWLQADINKLEKIQERSVGMVSGLRNKHYLGRCEELGIETLKKKRENKDLTQVYKIGTE